MKHLATLAAIAALSLASTPPVALGGYTAPPPREPRPRVPTAADLSRLEAAAAKRARRAARRRGGVA